ncbi:MAG TPA: site-2 protease family protein [Tepidisphaeraceae bacterium]|nr:site-2 protease family protein [Tepidisphaeraceae bacterium]
MAWQDRPYYRDGPAAHNPLMWLWVGSVHLFTIFGIRVRAHAQLLLLMLLVLLFGLGQGSTVEVRVQSMTILFAIVLLHEFGHCFAARSVGGEADEILMTPLGGLAMAMAPRNAWGTFVTIAGGPLVNVALCLICGIAIYFLSHNVLLTPWSISTHLPKHGWFQAYNYLYWIFVVSYVLLIFNILPVYPLDGGQLLQSILWPWMGYHKSMMLTLNIGLVGSVLMFMVGIATFGSIGGGLLLMLIAGSCFLNCLQMRWMMQAAGPEDEGDGIDYSAAYEIDPARKAKKKPLARWSVKRAAKKAQRVAKEEQNERAHIDAILAKVSAHGMQSLTWLEKRALHKATEHQRQRDMELKSKH